ncbi:putative DNA-invertase from lambdoid prophage Rac [Rickettsia argasii T170-B]|uniref:Putative DNA-invertase from lambdoid prophage Rac n=1 Tax=Rickettsia argasii T170-B TaxID=1268837 RepID=A0A0F3RBZ5_9RICK|nr:putative DNA-invertase from lambdoid prophage Rac [Rickettsia argasii T170-B]
MGVIDAIAQFERDLLIERTQSGLARAKLHGKTLGRPQILTELQKNRLYSNYKMTKLLHLLQDILIQTGKPLCVSEIITSKQTQNCLKQIYAYLP